MTSWHTTNGLDEAELIRFCAEAVEYRRAFIVTQETMLQLYADEVARLKDQAPAFGRKLIKAAR